MQHAQLQKPTGPPPAVYTVLRVIGCRLHWLACTGGWKPWLDHWTQNWSSSEREIAYQAARCAGGLLVRWTREEWADHLNRAASQGEANTEPESEVA